MEYIQANLVKKAVRCTKNQKKVVSIGFLDALRLLEMTCGAVSWSDVRANDRLVILLL